MMTQKMILFYEDQQIVPALPQQGGGGGDGGYETTWQRGAREIEWWWSFGRWMNRRWADEETAGRYEQRSGLEVARIERESQRPGVFAQRVHRWWMIETRPRDAQWPPPSSKSGRRRRRKRPEKSRKLGKSRIDPVTFGSSQPKEMRETAIFFFKKKEGDT